MGESRHKLLTHPLIFVLGANLLIVLLIRRPKRGNN